MPRPFRFAVYGTGNSRAAWVDYARKVESLGYSTLLVQDHITTPDLAPLPALATAAEATTTLRVGLHVLVNDYRHSALVAHEAATVDLLSDGRLEFGFGAGWMRDEAVNTERSPAEMLESPYALIGSVEQIVETLQERRERYGFSYITVFGDIDAFAPVVARLAGT